MTHALQKSSCIKNGCATQILLPAFGPSGGFGSNPSPQNDLCDNEMFLKFQKKKNQFVFSSSVQILSTISFKA